MKKIYYALMLSIVTFAFAACSDNDDEVKYATYDVQVALTALQTRDGAEVQLSDIAVKMTNAAGSVYEAATDARGVAAFNVPVGIYEVSASGTKSVNGYTYVFNGLKTGVTITQNWNSDEVIEVALTESKSGQVIIKELYVGGCQKDDGSGVFQMDKYVVLYNNSDQAASLENLCIGMVLPWNAHATNNDYVDGKLIYENQGWIPAGTGIWYFPAELTIPARQQIVVALNGAIDHTATYSQSVNLANSSYYCTYDISVYANTSYYPAPSDLIPTANYLKAVHYGTGNAWPLSAISPAFFIFQTQGVTPAAFANDPENTDYHGGVATAVNARKKVPVEWILDGIEVYTTTSSENKKRFTAQVDAGYVYLTNKYGYTLYRNVDKEATEAMEENQGKLVYNYALGQESTDPSNIDAEASIRNGAKVVYKDTNNSTNDFHQRGRSSLK